MPSQSFNDLSELDRPESTNGNGNGHAPPPPDVISGFGHVTRSRAPTGFEAGRQSDPKLKGGGFGFLLPLSEEKRPFGREDYTIDALKAIRDFDPQVSQATFNFLRLLNPGHTLKAYVGLGKDESEEQGRAQGFLDELAGVGSLADRAVGREYGGGLDQFHNVLALMEITEGAIAAEVAPTQDLKDVEDWYPIVPRLLSFRRLEQFEGDKIGKLTLGQRFKDGKWHAVNPNQVFYQPLDPDAEEPYGRPPFMAALQTVLSKSVMLNDLRAIAHNQGYPRLDIKVIWEQLAKAAPPSLMTGGQDKQLVDWMKRQLNLIVNDYNALQVDDTYVHYDWIDVGMVGPNYAATSFDFKGLEAILTRQINSALKMLPILTGYNETTSETHGSIQWEIQVAAILALRRQIKRIIEKLANASLQIAGFAAHAKMVYDPIRTVDRKFEAESAFLEAKTFQVHEQMGWAKNDDIAMELYGHNAVHPPVYPGATGKSPSGDSQLGEGDRTKTDEEKTVDRLAGLVRDKNGDVDVLAMAMEGRDPPAVSAFIRSVEEEQQDLVDRFATAGGVFFLQAKERLIEQLHAEKLIDEAPASAQQARDIADYVFGLRYSREMKRLLREAIRAGMLQAGIDDPVVPERIVERIWRDNTVYVRRIRDDLKEALRQGAFKTLDDVHDWFAENEYREVLMGRFMARQGISAGYAFGVADGNGNTRFRWVLGAAEHCPDCLARANQTFAFDELQSIGFPGSIALQCAANCHCSLVEA